MRYLKAGLLGALVALLVVIVLLVLMAMASDAEGRELAFGWMPLMVLVIAPGPMLLSALVAVLVRHLADQRRPPPSPDP